MKRPLVITTLLASALGGASLHAQVTFTERTPEAAAPEQATVQPPISAPSGAPPGSGVDPAAQTAPLVYQWNMNTLPTTWNPGAPAVGATLVLSKDAADPRELAKTEEDLNIMARILSKATAGQAAGQMPSAMGIYVHPVGGTDGSGPHNLYLEGYGALFLLRVDFPLLAANLKKPGEETKPETSTAWEEARREINQAANPMVRTLVAPDGLYGGAGHAYEPGRVETLKTDLLTALKHAAHIRKLRTEEDVTVVVSGRGSAPDMLHVTVVGAGSPARLAGHENGGLLVLRARKIDIDAFQKEKLSFEEFKKKAVVTLR